MMDECASVILQEFETASKAGWRKAGRSHIAM